MEASGKGQGKGKQMTATATAAKITYRKTGKGEWVAFGPASVIRAGATVTVHKKSGETKAETVDKVGRPFTVDGTEMVYGYLAESAPAARSYSGSYSRRGRSYSCEECEWNGDAGDMQGCDRHRGNPMI